MAVVATDNFVTVPAAAAAVATIIIRGYSFAEQPRELSRHILVPLQGDDDRCC